MGLLDIGNSMEDPRTLGLLSAAAALLDAGGRSTRPVNMGEALGRGLQGGMQGYQSGLSMQLSREKQDLLRQQMQQKEQPIPQLVEVDGVKKWVMPGQAEGVTVGKVQKSDPEWMTRDANGNPIVNPLYTQMKKETASAQPYFNFLPTASGYAVGDARSGTITPPGSSGVPNLIRAQDDPTLQGNIARAKEAGKTTGELGTKAQFDLPSAVGQAEQTLGLVDDLLNHPGLGQAVGKSRLLGIQKIPGTDAKDFDVRLDQLKGQQFMQAYQTLRGGGQITEVEGKKATDAISRMNPSSSEGEFRKAAEEFKGIIQAGVEREKSRASAGVQQSATAGPKVTQQDLEHTALKNGMTVEQVKQRLRASGVQVE